MSRIPKLGAVCVAGVLAFAGCAEVQAANPTPRLSTPIAVTNTPTTKSVSPTHTGSSESASTRTSPKTTTPSTPPGSPTSTRSRPKPAGAVTQPPLGTRVDCRQVACAALTFDDGPGRRSGELLRMLVRADVPATFFMLSSTAANNKETATAIGANPHMEVANHSITHPNLRTLSAGGVDHQVIGAQGRLERLTGRKITLFRPPYGATNGNVKAAAAHSGQAIILWDVDTRDWEHRNSARVVSTALQQVRPGSIILMHDIHSSTVDAVPNLIKALNQRGYTLVTVSTLLGGAKAGQTYTRR